jgi:thioredoxin-dependent peroxiredoxin
VRELREFREAHPQFQDEGIAIAGVSSDTLESHHRWIERLHIPYPLLSDPERIAGRALGLVRRIGIGAWGVELFRRATLLVDERGMVSAAWAEVRVRGHAQQVLAAGRALRRLRRPVSPSPPSG